MVMIYLIKGIERKEMNEKPSKNGTKKIAKFKNSTLVHMFLHGKSELIYHLKTYEQKSNVKS